MRDRSLSATQRGVSRPDAGRPLSSGTGDIAPNSRTFGSGWQPGTSTERSGMTAEIPRQTDISVTERRRQYSQLCEDDRARGIAVEGLNLAVLEAKDVAARRIHSLTSGWYGPGRQHQRPLVGSL